MSDQIICFRCNGTRKETITYYETCPHCKGAGAIGNTVHMFAWTYCPHCQGNKVIKKITDIICNVCQGKGYIR